MKARPLLFILLTASLLQLTSSALLTVVPVLLPDRAGVAFTVYSCAKLAFLYLAGVLTTRIGSARALPLAAALEGLALGLEALFPGALVELRAIEGIALALGMVSAFTLLRELHDDEKSMEASVARIMLFAGISLTLGPFVGGAVGDAHPLLFLGAAALLYLLLASAMILLRPFPFNAGGGPHERYDSARVGSSIAPTPKRPALGPEDLGLIVALAATHAVGLGLQPLIAHWGKTYFPVSGYGGAITFLSIGLGFFAGVALRIQTERGIARFVDGAILVGFLGAEASIALVVRAGETSVVLRAVWLASVALIGFWYGIRSKRLTARLGLSGEAHKGGDQAQWLFWTGLPSALTPILTWRLRDPIAHADGRYLFEAVVILLSAGTIRWLHTRPKFDRI